MFHLTYKGVRFPIRRAETVIGRSTYCSIVIPSDGVSREHARLVLDGDRLEIVDLDSRNGITVNGERVKKRTLAAGDVIGLGPELLIVQTEVLTASAQTAASVPRPPLDSEPEHTAQFQVRIDIGHAERLVANANTLADPRAMAKEVRRTIELVADDLARTTDRGKKIRLLGLTEIVASWYPDNALEGWKTSIAKRLGLAVL